MESEQEIADKVREILKRLGGKECRFDESISIFAERLKLLSDSGRYGGLRKRIFAANDWNGFRSYAFEVGFAYDFESNGREMAYEVRALSEGRSSVDFRYQSDKKTVHFELRLIAQKKEISDSIRSQLDATGSYAILRNGEGEKGEVVRIQNLALSKCMDEDGQPIKFPPPKIGEYNVIVCNVSETLLGCIDTQDCLLAMYGDPAVPRECERGVFGLCQELPDSAPGQIREYYDKFKHFRETIHGLLFVRKPRQFIEPLLEWESEYNFVPNCTLMRENEIADIDRDLGSFLKPWRDPNGET
ncbi:MAG: hypothetical protein AB1696_18780 [Planctomycetota bacterium]